MTYHYAPILMHLSLPHPESEMLLFAAGGNYTKTHCWSRCREFETVACSALWDISITRHLSPFRDHCRRWSRKIVRAKMMGNYKETVFQTQKGSCTNKLTALVKACTRLLQAQSRKQSQHEDGEWAQSPTPVQGLLAIDSYWKRVSLP